MRKTSRSALFFGLTPVEKRVFSALPTDVATSVLRISEKARVPRTTTTRIIAKLHQRGLARKVTKGGRTCWKQPAHSVLTQQLHDGRSLFGVQKKGTLTTKRAVYTSDAVRIQTLSGASVIQDVYSEAFQGRPNERAYLTQLAPAMKAVRKKFPVKSLNNINKTGREHKNILELIMTEDAKREYIRIAHTDKSWIKGADERLVDISVVPDRHFVDCVSELLIFRDTIMLTDWESETAILIHNAELARMLRGIFSIAKSTGDRFDHHSFLRMLSELVEKPVTA